MLTMSSLPLILILPKSQSCKLLRLRVVELGVEDKVGRVVQCCICKMKRKRGGRHVNAQRLEWLTCHTSSAMRQCCSSRLGFSSKSISGECFEV